MIGSPSVFPPFIHSSRSGSRPTVGVDVVDHSLIMHQFPIGLSRSHWNSL